MATKKDYETLDYYMKRETQPTYRTGGTTQKSSDSAAGEEKDTGKGTTARDTLDFYMNRNTKPQYRNSVQELGESEDSGIRDWFDRYDKVIRGVTDYAAKRNGGYTTDASGGFSEDIASLIDEYEGIKGYAPGYGVYNPAKYLNTLKNLQKTISETDQIMAYFGSEEAYNKFVSEQESYERKRTADLPELEKEIAQLEQQREDTKDRASMYQSIYDAPVSRLKRKFGSDDGWEDIRQQGTKVLDAEISQKKLFLNQAKLIQEQERLSSVADDPAFAQFSGYTDTEHYDPVYEYINDKNGARAKIKAEYIHVNAGDGVSTDGITPYEEKGYDLMTEDEIAIYNYHYAKGDREEAQDYLNSIQESLNSRQAFRGFEDIEDNTALELIFGVSAGLDQFKSGMYGAVQAVTGEADYMPVSAFQMTSGMVREDLADKGPKILGNSLGQVAYDTVTTSANMLPSILASSYVGAINPVAGEAVGNVLLGASAGGNAYQEMLNLGYDKSQAKAYAEMVTASEVGLQYLLGGISKLGGKITGKGIETILNHVDNAMARVAIQLVGSGMSEFSEEYLQDVLEPWFQNLALKTDNDISLFSTDALYSGLLGFVTAGVFEGTGIISGEANTYALGRDLQNSGITAERLAELGKTYSADTVAYRLAGKVDANTGAYTIGRLFNEIGATLTEQNKADIASSLESKGMDADIAQKHAEIMEYVVEGGTLSDTQMKMIEKNDVLANTLREVIIDPNSTVNQRISGYNEMAKQMETGNASENASRTKQALPGQENVEKENSLPTEKTKAAESGYTVSDDGKTTRVSTGEEVQIQKIDSIKDGKITFRLKDGSTADASDIQYAIEDEALIYEAVAGLDVNAMAANILVDAFYTSKDVPANYYALGIQEAFRYGLWNAPKQDMNNGPFSSILTEHQRNVAYENGRIVARQRAEQEQAAKAKQGSKKETGKVHYEGNRSSLNERQRTSLSALETIADALGIQIYVFESDVDAKGKHIGENGWYDLKDGSIHIDLFAGTSGQDTMLFTAAHELTHFIRDNSPAKFQTLADFLMEEYGKKGVSVRYLVDEQIRKAKKNGRTIDYDTAYEEVVADSMETMLSDGKVVEKLRQKDKSLWEMVKGYIHDLAEKIRKVYAGLKPDSTEGKLVAEMKDSIEKIQELFTEGLLDAGENYRGTTGKENTANVGGEVKHSLREFEDGTRFVDVQMDAHVFDGMTVAEMNRIAKTILMERFAGKVIGIDNRVFVNGDSVNEYLHPSKSIDIDTRKAKLTASGELDNLLDAGTPLPNEPDGKDGHVHPDAIDFSYFKTIFKIGSEYFEGIVNVKNIKRGKLLKDVTKIRNITEDIVSSYGQNPKSNFLRDASMDSIRNTKEKVNKKFSDRDPSVARMNQALEKENAKLKDDVTELRKLLKLQKSLTHGTMFNKSSVESMAKALMENAGAKGPKAELAGLLNDVYTYIARNEELTWEGVVEKAQPAVDWLQEHMETGQQVDAYGAEILRELRGSRIYLDENQKKEAAYQFGSFNAYRKQLFGTVNITEKNAVSLDTKWAELAEMYPDVFDANITSTDMPGALLDAVGSLRDMGMVENWYDQSAAAQDLLTQVYDGYWRVSTLQTVADVKQKQIDQLKDKHIARMEKLKATHKDQIAKLKQEHREDLKKVRQEYRTNAEAKQQEVVQKYREAKQDSFLASQDAKIMEREFIRLVKEYEKANDKAEENQNKLKEKRKQELEHYKEDRKTLEREFDRLLDEYDKQTDKDKAKQDTLKEKLKQEVKSHKEDSKTWEREFERLTAEYEKAGRNIDKLQKNLEYQRKSAKEKVESRKQTVIRNQIKDIGDKFHKMLTAPSKADTLHVPIRLTNAVAQFCDIFAESEERMLEREADRLNTRKVDLTYSIARSAYNDANVKEAGIIERKNARIAKTAEKLKAMREQYADIKADSALGMYYDEHTAGLIEELSKGLSGTDIYDMNSDQLKAVYNTMKSMMNAIVKANKVDSMGKDKTLLGVVKKMSSEIDQVDTRVNGAAITWRRYMQWQMSPDTFFDYICGYIKDNEGKAVQKMFSDGTERMLGVQRDFYNMFQHLTETKNKQDAKDLRDMMENPTKNMVDWGLKDADGNPVKTSKGMMLMEYMLLMQEDSLESMAYGGLKIPRAKEYYKGNVDAAYGDAKESSLLSSAAGEDISELVHQVNSLKKDLAADGINESQKEDIQKQIAELERRRDTLAEGEKARLLEMREAIGKSLTPLEKDIVDTAYEWFRYTGKLMNEVHEQMHGYRLNLVENYVPIHRDLTTVKTDIRETEDAFNLENSGFTKERVKSHAPILLTDLFVELANQQQKISRYYGFAQVQKDFNRIWNMKLPGARSSIESKVAAKYGTGKTLFGVSGTAYIENYIKAVSGANQGNDILGTFYGYAASATLSLNPRVAFSQLASIPTASAVVGWKSMAAGFAKGIGTSISTKKKNELAQKSVWFFQRYRGEGGITEIADLNTNSGLWSKVSSSKVGKWLFNWCQNFDVFATASMWSMAEDYVQSHGTKKGSEGYDAAVEQVYADIIRKTQPNYTTTERSDLLRDKRGGMKLLTMYKTQPNQNLNILLAANGEFMRAKQDLKAGRNGVTNADVKAAGANLANAVTSVTIGGTLTFVVLRTMVNFLMGMVNPYRDDDTDEVTMEETLKGMGKEMLSSLAGMFALGGQLYDMVNAVISRDSYYGISDSAISLIADAADTTVTTLQKLTDPEEELKWVQVEKQINAVLTAFGVPYNNAKKFVNAAKMWHDDMKNGTFGEYTRENTTDNQYRARFVEAYRAGDIEKCNDILTYLLAQSDAPNDRRAVKELQSGFKEYLKGQFVKEKVTDQEVTDILRDYLDMDSEEITSALNQWHGIVDTGKTASQEEEAYLKREVSSEEYIEYLTKYSGKSQEDAAVAEKKLRCERDEEIAYSDIDELYIHGELSGSKASEYLQKYGDVSSDDAEQKLLEWDFEREYGIKWSDKKEAYLDGEISAKDLRNALISVGGKNAEDADAYIDDLDFEKRHNFSYSDRKSAYLNGVISRSKLKSILINERGYDEEYAELTLDAYDWARNHPKYNYSTTSIMAYLKPLEDLEYSAEEYGIPVETFVKERKYIDSIESDKDENGKGIAYSRINKAFPYINSLPLTAEQKTAFAVACGWSLKTVKKNKLW